MWPGEVPSDLDIEEANHDRLAGRWAILIDLCSEFQGEFGAYLVFAFLIPGLLVAMVIFEGTERPVLTLAIAAVTFIVCITVSLHAFIWFRWAKKREREAYDLIHKKSQE